MNFGMTSSRIAMPLLLSLIAVTAGGCAKRGMVKDSGYEATPPPKKEVVVRHNGAIYQPGMRVGLFEDVTARHVGDILTIVLVEQTSATSSSETSAEKEQNVDMPPPKVAGDDVTADGRQVLENEVSANRDFKGSGDSEQSHSFEGRISVTVAEVLPNDYLVVKGEKLITLNQANDYIRFSGIVRIQDIRPDNTVQSGQVANVHLSYAGEGDLSSANQMGSLGRFFQSPAYPY